MLHMFKKILSLLLGLICAIFRCKRGKVKEKDDENFVPTEIVVVKPNESQVGLQTDFYQQRHTANGNINDVIGTGNGFNNDDIGDDVTLQDWNSWGTGTTNDQDTIAASTVQETTEPDSVNFFQDMEPSVKVKKVYVKKSRQPRQGIGNMLAVKSEDEIKLSAELTSWDDEEVEEAGWEEEDIDINCDQIAAEAKQLRMQERKRKSEEMKRQKQLKKQQVATQHKLGMKVS